MAIVPGQSSGTYSFALSNTSVVLEAFDRCRIRPPLITRHMTFSARNSLNLEFLDWSNIGINLWKVISGTITLTPGESTYVLDQSLETLTEVWYSQIDGNGVGQNNDRFMVPVTRTQYAMIPNKQTPGTPSQYWLEMLAIPQVTIWPVPSIGAPNYAIEWFGLQRIQDANLGSGEAPNIVYRAYDALCAKLALRLLTKFGPDDPAKMAAQRTILKEEAEIAWNNFQTRDQETGPMMIQPAVGAYGRIS